MLLSLHTDLVKQLWNNFLIPAVAVGTPSRFGWIYESRTPSQYYSRVCEETLLYHGLEWTRLVGIWFPSCALAFFLQGLT